jgi:hypothetical protein
MLLPPSKFQKGARGSCRAPRMHRPHGLSVPPPRKIRPEKFLRAASITLQSRKATGIGFHRCRASGHVIEKIRGDLLAFDLQPGAMREEAQLVAEMLNRHIASISLTIVP